MLTNNLVLIQEYDPTSPDAFSKLAARINAALGSLVVAIEHFGSTAVPGIAAKPYPAKAGIAISTFSA